MSRRPAGAVRHPSVGRSSVRHSSVRQSKLLATILRHQPHRAGVVTDPDQRAAAGLPRLWDGWVPVRDVLAAGRDAGVELDVPALVAGSDKQRFALSDDGTLVRANQGHSVPVDLGLDAVAPPAVLYHGTARSRLDAILREGLRPMGRHAVHLSADVPTARAVGSRRRGPVVVLAVDAAAMHRAGRSFSRSANGVWLTAAVPPGCLTPIDGLTSDL